jgi:DNA-binding transcriptional regulator GbsR (MarR family)
MKHGLIECECKSMPAKRYFRITNDMEILMKLIDEGTEICKKISAKANKNSCENDEISNESSYEKSEILEDVKSVENVENSLEKAVQTAEKLQYLPKAVTDDGAQSSCPSAVSCTRPADNHTIKPKINNLKLNQSINSSKIAENRNVENVEKIDRLNSAPLNFSEIMESLGLDWYTFTANEPMSEKHFLYQ